MTTKESIAKAASLFAEWVEGDRFEFKSPHHGWCPCSADEVVGMLLGDTAVRIKPRTKKVLRPAWEILRDAMERDVLLIEDDTSVFIDMGSAVFSLADVIGNHPILEEAPDWFFTPEEPKR